MYTLQSQPYRKSRLANDSINFHDKQPPLPLPETNRSPLKINGWKMYFLLGPGLFSEATCEFQRVYLIPKTSQNYL